MAADKDRASEVLEEGDIFFLYRPAVEEDAPSGLEDVQRFHLVLRPQEGKLRLLTVGRKRLPDVDEHERNWGFVALVSASAKKIEEALQEQVYETGTRGERRLPAARPAGEGVYAVTLEGGQLHLAYVLELPEDPKEVQQALKIAPEASFAISIKNPEAGQPSGVGLPAEEKADYPKELRNQFRGRRFASEDLRMLDYGGAEFILIGAHRDPEEAYGIELDRQKEDYEHADTIRRLQVVKSRHPVKPLFEGKWA